RGLSGHPRGPRRRGLARRLGRLGSRLPGNVQRVTAIAGPPGLTVARGSAPEAFAALGPEWDELVRSMRRPSPFLLHTWLTEWWRHYGEGNELCVLVAHRDGRLVGAL